jgi:uncharacterized protein YcfL
VPAAPGKDIKGELIMPVSRLIFPVIAVAFLLPLSGCQAPQPVPYEPMREVSLEEFFTPPSEKVISTADSIVVKGIRTKYSHGHLRVDFKLLNNRGRRNVINYRIQWLDNEGMLATRYDEWRTIAFEGQQELIITGRSPSLRSVDYRLELQAN